MLNKTFIVLIAATVVALPAQAKKYHDSHYAGHEYDYAKVVDVRPVYETVEVEKPYKQCWYEPARYSRHGNSKSYTPEVFGAIIGAAVGNRFGKGSGRDAATVAGALLGGSVARDIKRDRNRSVHRGQVERCDVRHTYETEQRVSGYDVAYRYNGNVYHTRMPEHPGKRIRVQVSVRPA